MVERKTAKTKSGNPEKKQISKKDDVADLTKKVAKLKQHLAKNKHDYRTKRALMIKQAKLNKLKKYRKKRSG